MDIVARLREEAASEHSLYTEFILKLSGNTDQMICFFEGKNDYKYYGIRVENICQKDFNYISCDGKENVLAVKRLIEQHDAYKSLSLSYFVDMDFEQKINEDKIYSLPSYSIENQYANEHALKKILKNEFSLSKVDEDYATVEKLFKKTALDFKNRVTFINAWLACQAEKRVNGESSYLKVDNTIGRYFTNVVKQDFRVDSLDDLNSLDSIESLFPNAPKISMEELDIKLKLWKTIDATYFFRGKFQLAFFSSFLERVKAEACQKNPKIFKKKHKCNLRFEYATALTYLSIYAQTPSCLIEFLNGQLKAIA